MFGLGFTEMLILGVIILVFVGPNEIPEVARMIGRFLAELRRSTDAIKGEWNKTTEDIRPNRIRDELNNSISQVMENKPNPASPPTLESTPPTDSTKTENEPK